MDISMKGRELANTGGHCVSMLAASMNRGFSREWW